MLAKVLKVVPEVLQELFEIVLNMDIFSMSLIKAEGLYTRNRK